MANVCQKCGDCGYSWLLVSCSGCNKFVEHQYCLDELPKEDEENIEWLCEECEPCNTAFVEDDESEMSNDESMPQNLAVSQKKKELLHVPSFKHLGLKTWGRYKKRELNRGRSSLGTTTTSLKDDVALPNSRALDEEKSSEAAKPCVHMRKLILPTESEENVLHNGPTTDDCKNTEEREIQPKEGEFNASVEHDSSNSRKRKSDSPSRVDERSMGLVISQPVEDKVEQTNEFYYISAWPIVNYSWRGFFKTGGKSYGPFNGHLSTKACEKAWNATKTLPPVVHFSLVLRSHVWPKSVDVLPPTDDHIALFFFPCYSWVEQMVEPQLQEIIKGDLVLKVVMDNAELLVLPSTLLPRDYQKFEDKFYLWGTYKSRKPVPSKPAANKQDQHVTTNHTAISSQPLNTKTTEPEWCETCDKNQEKNREEEENESSHLTDESNDDLELADSANKKSRGNELDLFPVQVENIALRSKLGEGKRRLDLELGLSLPFTQ
ncbi:hypothetical protein LUZ60_007474 [Juncus effusus]|nr:hypothetical protein LUZ60_007474 [Juncus effusus]